MKKNKIVIVADNSGRIVGCVLPYERAARRTSEQETKLVAMPGQIVYEAEIPRELVKHIGRASFAEEIFRYRIGPQARLVRAKERRKKSGS